MVDNVYVDTDNDPGFGYKLCYMSKNLTGNVGIVDSAGNIVIEPSYVSAFRFARIDLWSKRLSIIPYMRLL